MGRKNISTAPTKLHKWRDISFLQILSSLRPITVPYSHLVMLPFVTIIAIPERASVCGLIHHSGKDLHLGLNDVDTQDLSDSLLFALGYKNLLSVHDAPSWMGCVQYYTTIGNSQQNAYSADVMDQAPRWNVLFQRSLLSSLYCKNTSTVTKPYLPTKTETSTAASWHLQTCHFANQSWFRSRAFVKKCKHLWAAVTSLGGTCGEYLDMTITRHTAC